MLHNLRIKKVDPRIVNWIGSFLTDRSTIFKTNEYTAEKIHISTRIPQGSPLFPILFFFYNSPLLEKLNLEPNIHAAGFVDDIAILVEGNTTEDKNIKLSNVHLKQLISVQYQAARAIAGAYRATSSPALDIETYTLPLKQKFDYYTAKMVLTSGGHD